MPSFDFIRQTALYIDRLYVYDPLFSFYNPPSQYSKIMSEFFGFKKNGVLDRPKLRKAVEYLKALTPFVVYDYVQIIPFQHRPDLSKGVKIFASENQYQFRELLPNKIRSWFHDRVTVRSMQQSTSSWVVLDDLHPCRGIFISFQGSDSRGGRIYHLFEQEIVEFDQNSGKYTAKMQLPSDPPEQNYFNAWVEQSINRASSDIFEKTLS